MRQHKVLIRTPANSEAKLAYIQSLKEKCAACDKTPFFEPGVFECGIVKCKPKVKESKK
jgi:hypothetical protein